MRERLEKRLRHALWVVVPALSLLALPTVGQAGRLLLGGQVTERDAAGRPLRLDQAVMDSETFTGNRNRAIAWLMRNFGIIDEHVNESLHQYFAQCSMLVNCQDVAMMAASFASRAREAVRTSASPPK